MACLESLEGIQIQFTGPGQPQARREAPRINRHPAEVVLIYGNLGRSLHAILILKLTRSHRWMLEGLSSEHGFHELWRDFGSCR